MYLYSPNTRGFYVRNLHAQIPEDAVTVSAEEHAALLAGQAAGQAIMVVGGAAVLAPRPPPLAPAPVRHIAPLAFRRRLGSDQRRALTLAASAAMDATPPDATLQTFLDDLASARWVDLDDPETIGGVAAMQAAGLLSAEDATALLADGTADEAA